MTKHCPSSRRVRYGIKNPPHSVAEVEDILHELYVSEKQIANQLEFQTEDEYESFDDYIDWKDAAIRALSFIQAEIRFLEGWLERGGKTLQQVGEIVKEYEQKRKELVDRFRVELNQLTVSGISKSEAQHQLKKLGQIEQRFVFEIRDLNKILELNHIKPHIVKSLKIPLNKLLDTFKTTRLQLKRVR